MLDVHLMEKIVRLEPTERLELISAVWESLSPFAFPIYSGIVLLVGM